MADQAPSDQQPPVKHISINRFRVQCPKCKAFYKCALEDYSIAELEQDGSLTIALRPDSCKHLFLVYLDAKLNARTTQYIHDAKVQIVLIRTDPDNLLQKERDIIDKHNDAVARNVHAEIEETWQELKRIRKEITRLGLD
ncbi:MAG: hypothetical protein JW839_13065 [Candidatus Lokiarchaeota archaeon]|nr:hypothetical protein [Candidatus Lokiarchaeota archaeon]